MKRIVALALVAVLLIATTANAKRVLDYDSVGVLYINSTVACTTTTWGGSNVDHATGAEMNIFCKDPEGGTIYRTVTIRGWSYIGYIDSVLADMHEPTYWDGGTQFWDSDSCTGDCDSITYMQSSDSTSLADSVNFYLVIEESFGGEVVIDSASPSWTSLDSILVSSQRVAFNVTVTPARPYLRVRVSAVAATEADTKDSIYCIVSMNRSNADYGLETIFPDFLGCLKVQDTLSSRITDTLTTWPHANRDHNVGEIISFLYGNDGSIYSNVFVRIDDVPTASADDDSATGYCVLDQSFDLVTWYLVDSIYISGGVADTATFALLPFPYGRFRTQSGDSTDISTGSNLHLTMLRQK